jgi:hypothetical protein
MEEYRMRKIIGRFIVKETNIDATDQSVISYGSSKNPDDGSNDARVTVYDVCLRDESNGDLLLINSTTGHCMLIGSGTNFNSSGKVLFNDRRTR